MANLSGNGSTNEYSNRPVPVARPANMPLVLSIIAGFILIAGVVGYVYENPSPVAPASATNPAATQTPPNSTKP